MPVFTVTELVFSADFTVKWKLWHLQDVERHRNKGDIKGNMDIAGFQVAELVSDASFALK